jgi:predicted small lipoprotein YifL
MMHKPRRLFLLILLVAVLCLAACGKKGDPLPPERAVPAAAVDFSAREVPGGIQLRWHMPERSGEIHRIRILRREIGMTDSGCADCADQTQVLLDLYSDDPLLVREGERSFHYLDATPSPERTYGYRIVLCNVSGYCSEASQEATTGKKVEKE